jgi:hypothetical protein
MESKFMKSLIKHLTNIMILITSTLLPIIALDWIFSIYKWNGEWVTPIIILTGGLLGIEIVSVRRAQGFVWATISRTLQDKIVFASSLVVLLLLSVWPTQQKAGPIISFLFVVMGGIASLAILYIFGTPNLRTNLLKQSRTP